MPLRALGLAAYAIAALFPAVTSAQLWTAQTSGTTIPLQQVWFTNASNGWAVGDAGTSIATPDGGATWTSFFITVQDLQDVTFLDTSTGLIVGDNGLIFRTVNAGVSWAPVASGTGSNLRAAAFGGGGAAYAAGRDGTITRSVDSGASWSLVETGAVRYLDAAAVAARAWIVGEGGVIRATTDGGATWSNLASGTASDLQGVHFVSETEGWVGGQNNTLRYTSDGGATWTSRNTGIFVGVDAVHFVDSNVGWAVGGAGNIFHTTNGGLLWVSEASGTTNELNDVFFVNGALGWTVGAAGTILTRQDPNVGAPEIAGAAEALSPRAAPNPFRTSSTIAYTLPHGASAVVSIHDASGRLVKTLDHEASGVGQHAVVWDGSDRHGSRVPAGTYFYRILSDRQSAGGKLTVIR